MTQLLTLCNGAALHKALRAQGLGVSYRTVARWIGDEPESKPPADVLPYIERVFGLRTAEEPTEPSWVGRLEAKLDELVATKQRMRDETVEKVFEALDPERIGRATQLLERLEAQLPPPDVDAPGRSEEQDPAGAEPPRQGGE